MRIRPLIRLLTLSSLLLALGCATAAKCTLYVLEAWERGEESADECDAKDRWQGYSHDDH